MWTCDIIHDVIRDVERKKERKKERKTPEAMENWKMRVATCITSSDGYITDYMWTSFSKGMVFKPK